MITERSSDFSEVFEMNYVPIANQNGKTTCFEKMFIIGVIRDFWRLQSNNAPTRKQMSSRLNIPF